MPVLRFVVGAEFLGSGGLFFGLVTVSVTWAAFCSKAAMAAEILGRQCLFLVDSTGGTWFQVLLFLPSFGDTSNLFDLTCGRQKVRLAIVSQRPMLFRGNEGMPSSFADPQMEKSSFRFPAFVPA